MDSLGAFMEYLLLSTCGSETQTDYKHPSWQVALPAWIAAIVVYSFLCSDAYTLSDNNLCERYGYNTL